MTERATEKIVVRLVRNGPHWRHWRHSAFCDPAFRAEVVGTVHDRIVRKALKRMARRIALRLYYRSLCLQCCKFSIQFRYALMRLFREICCVVQKLVLNAHIRRPVEPNL
jgi:hypothetical protein